MAISLNHQASPVVEKSHGEPTKFPRRQWGDIIPDFGRKIKPVEVLFFTSQLSLMLEIGTPVNRAIDTIKDQIQNTAFKELVRAMLQDIEGGRQLSDAMKGHPRVFSSVMTSMIKAGETGGFLKQILDRSVEMQEKRQALKTQLRSALTYPAVLCVISVLVVLFILVSVLPKFTAFFEGKESLLPFTTKFLMNMSASLQDYWWAYILSSLGLAVGLKFAKESKMGGALIDRLSVSGPLIGRVFNKIYTCQFLRTLGSLLESHVPMLEALEATRTTIQNRYFRDFIDKIVDHVQEGGRFSRPFSNYPYTMDSVKQMVATGEEAGNLPKVMLRLAEFYDKEVERELKNFASLIEPVALIIMGVVVGLIVSSVILPLFKLAHGVH
jgi:type II secretory pathway component PulF